MTYDKKQFLNMLAAGLCSKARTGKQLPTTYIAAGQTNRTVYSGKHFRSTLDMTNYPVHIMGNNAVGSPASRYLYSCTMSTLPDTVTIPFSQLRYNSLGFHALYIVIETPYVLTNQKFARFAMRFPSMPDVVRQCNPLLYISCGTMDQSDGIDFFRPSLFSYLSAYMDGTDLCVSDMGEECVPGFNDLQLSGENGIFADNEYRFTMLGAFVQIHSDEQIEGNLTLDFSNFFVEFIQ